MCDRRIGTAFAEDEISERFEVMIGRPVGYGAARSFLFQQAGRGEKAQVMRQRRGWNIRSVLDFANGETVVAGPDLRA